MIYTGIISYGCTTCMCKNSKLTLTNYYYMSITNTLALQINKNTSELCHGSLAKYAMKKQWT